MIAGGLPIQWLSFLIQLWDKPDTPFIIVRGTPPIWRAILSHELHQKVLIKFFSIFS